MTWHDMTYRHIHSHVCGACMYCLADAVEQMSGIVQDSDSLKVSLCLSSPDRISHPPTLRLNLVYYSNVWKCHRNLSPINVANHFLAHKFVWFSRYFHMTHSSLHSTRRWRSGGNITPRCSVNISPTRAAPLRFLCVCVEQFVSQLSIKQKCNSVLSCSCMHQIQWYT